MKSQKIVFFFSLAKNKHLHSIKMINMSVRTHGIKQRFSSNIVFKYSLLPFDTGKLTHRAF